MEKIQIGEVIKLNNNKEYMCACEVQKDNFNYVYLITKTKPIEIVFAKYDISSDDELILIGNQKEKLEVLELFKNQIINIKDL